MTKYAKNVYRDFPITVNRGNSPLCPTSLEIISWAKESGVDAGYEVSEAIRKTPKRGTIVSYELVEDSGDYTLVVGYSVEPTEAALSKMKVKEDKDAAIISARVTQE